MRDAIESRNVTLIGGIGQAVESTESPDNNGSTTSTSPRRQQKRRKENGLYWKEEKDTTRNLPRGQKVEGVSMFSIESKTDDDNDQSDESTTEEANDVIGYEALRLENIRRNEAYLKSIGLLSTPTLPKPPHPKKPSSSSS
ncbi:hypothetical protein EON65_52610, partial [archaeon]